MHFAGAKAAEDREEVDLTDMRKAQEDVKGKVAATKAHELNGLWEELLCDVESAVSQDLVLLVINRRCICPKAFRSPIFVKEEAFALPRQDRLDTLLHVIVEVLILVRAVR